MRDHWLLPDEPLESYAEYLERTGSDAVARARGMPPEQVLDELHRSGLRGRGGAGFPAGIKWRTLATHPCPVRHVVCNAAEGEPGTFKDRMLLRRNPYALLEGMLIAAHVVGAEKAVIAAKASFEPELERLRSAIAELEAAGLLAGLELSIYEGPSEYLFGEEKALLNAIEDDLPLPREADKPPYEQGLYATPLSPNPALVNNVETFAHVPSIVQHGGDSFRTLGSSDTPGTILVTVCGAARRPGVYEVEAGTTLREILHDLGGGPREGELKAVLSGVSTGVILPSALDTPADFGSMALVGSGLGSAGLIVLDGTASIPRVAQTLARFLYVESCNQCAACKHGLRKASSAIDELFDPELATPDDIERALYGARSAPQGNRCYLPVQGSILIPSLMERFADEFEAQLREPDASAPPWALPLIVDFDPARGDFVYDRLHEFKQPDWTYVLPEATEAPRHSAAAASPGGAFGLQLEPAVLTALEVRAAQTGEALDRVANRLLREALSVD